MQTKGDVGMAIERLQAYFVGIPDARLTVVEAIRIGEIDYDRCRQLVTALVEVRFLSREWDGSYRRRTPLFSEESAPASAFTRRMGLPHVGR